MPEAFFISAYANSTSSMEKLSLNIVAGKCDYPKKNFLIHWNRLVLHNVIDVAQVERLKGDVTISGSGRLNCDRAK